MYMEFVCESNRWCEQGKFCVTKMKNLDFLVIAIMEKQMTFCDCDTLNSNPGSSVSCQILSKGFEMETQLLLQQKGYNQKF